MMGLKVTASVVAALPFLAVALVSDNLIILLKVFETPGGKLSIARLTQRAFRRVGPTITMASLCCFAAFMTGVIIELNEIRYFCRVAAVAMLFG
eukprot:UN28260